MADVALPAGLCPVGYSFTVAPNKRAFAGGLGAEEPPVDLLEDRWMVSMTLDISQGVKAGQVEAYINRLSGGFNTTNLHHFSRPVPRGTATTSSGLTFNASKGADTVIITTSIGATLLPGDMLKVGTLLLQVSESCTANGVGQLTVPLVNRLRVNLTAGAAVVLSSPTATFRLLQSVAMPYGPAYAEGVTLMFEEAING